MSGVGGRLKVLLTITPPFPSLFRHHCGMPTTTYRHTQGNAHFMLLMRSFRQDQKLKVSLHQLKCCFDFFGLLIDPSIDRHCPSPSTCICMYSCIIVTKNATVPAPLVSPCLFPRLLTCLCPNLLQCPRPPPQQWSQCKVEQVLHYVCNRGTSAQSRASGYWFKGFYFRA